MDEPADFALVEQIYQRLYPSNPAFATDDILALLAREPQLATLNTQHQRNEGWRDRWPRGEPLMTSRYQHSLTPLSPGRAEHSLRVPDLLQEPPLLPLRRRPLFIERGQGARVWDVDGNEYLDFASGLLAISLGYCDPG